MQILRALFERLDSFMATAAELAWGAPLAGLLLGAGLLLTLYCRFLPFRGLGHGIRILRGVYDRKDDPGEISHFRALSTALSSTIGMGNIGGVAIAISEGGPGAIFWMWLAAFVGMATKFFTCTLAVLYRGKDSLGRLQGGPMYFIEEGLGRRWRFLGAFFSIFGIIGCLGMFQTNQLAEILHDSVQVPPWVTGLVSVAVVAIVILGGIQRIAAVAARLVPLMCVIYLGMAVVVVVLNYEQVPSLLALIVNEAFDFRSFFGGAAGTAFIIGVRRAAFSNEAGIGTAPMAHGAAKTAEPVREGLVAMLGPFIDTVIVCTVTALVVLSSGLWDGWTDANGAALTAAAVEATLGPVGRFLLVAVVALFAITTMFGYSYYGKKCFSYLFGAQRARVYDYIYLGGLFLGAVWSANLVLNVLDTAFALMAVPNLIATIILAPKVMAATKDYFARLGAGARDCAPLQGSEGE